MLLNVSVHKTKNLTHRDLSDSLRVQLPINAGELALTLAPARLRFRCDLGGEDHGREAG